MTLDFESFQSTIMGLTFQKLNWWVMLSLKSMFFFCMFVSMILAIIPFMGLPVLTTNTEFIGSYGAYLSGTVAPLIALFAFGGILQTLRFQQSQIQLQQKQIDLMSVDVKKKEIALNLEKFEKAIKESLNNNTLEFQINDNGGNYSLYQVMTMILFTEDYSKTIKHNDWYSGIDRDNSEKLSRNDCIIFEAVGSASIYVARMAEYIEAYKAISNDKFEIGYYYNKYDTLATRLYNLGFLESKKYSFWENKLNVNTSKLTY